MNVRIKNFLFQAGIYDGREQLYWSSGEQLENFAELIMHDIHKKVIASILITDVLMEEKGQVPTSEDYIRAINKDLEIEQ